MTDTPMLHDLAMPANVAIFIASGAVVWIAGGRLARNADAIASKTGLGRVFLGMILLGGVTSLPEVAVAVTATLQNVPALTVNDLLGSAAANLVILAVADAVMGHRSLSASQRSSQVLLQGVLGILLMALIVAAVLTGDVLVLGVGAWSWILLAVYLCSVWILARPGAGAAWKPIRAPPPPVGESLMKDAEAMALRLLVIRTVVVAAAILAAGYGLTMSAEALSRQSGLGTSFFGVVFLAISTSLPEVSTVIAAVRLRRYEMAISDVFGTNLVNVTIVVLVDALHGGGPVLVEVGRSASIAALMALLLTAIFLIGMIERRERTVLRMGLDSIAALLVYAGGIVLLYLHR